MTAVIASESNPAAQVECLAHAIGDALDGLHATGASPHAVAEAAFLAALPWLLEVTRTGTIEACLLSLAARFDGNAIRTAN